MRRVSLVSLAARDLVAARGRALLSAAGIAVGVMVLLVIIGLGLGARRLLLDAVVRALPSDMVEVVPRTLDLGLFRLGTNALFGGRALDGEALRALEAIDGVAEAYPRLRVALPLGARGGERLFGRPLYTDLFMQGVPPALVEPEVGAEFHDRDDFVPVVISDQLIDVYNHSVAPSLGTPRVTAQTLVGFGFDLVIGRSLMLGSRGSRQSGTVRARIVGVSRYAMRLGVTVPIATARRLLATYGAPDAGAERYDSVLLQAKKAAAIPGVIAAVERLGLGVDASAKRMGRIATGATLFAALVGLLVLALAGVSIAHSFFAQLTERRRELAILRAVGARRSDLVTLVLLEAACVGLAGGIVGIGLAHAVTGTVNLGATSLLSQLPLATDTLVALPLWSDGLALGAALLAATSGALWPAVRAATLPVADALAEG